MQAHFSRHLKVGSLCAAILCASCLDFGRSTRPAPTPLPDPSPAAQAFIDSAGLPLYHDSHQLFMQGSVEVFSAGYGPGMDCPSGCFSSSALGLRVAAKKGWIKLWDYNAGFAPDSTQYFDVTPADTVLGGQTLWISLEAVDEADIWFWQSYLPLIARDSDVARDVLHRIPGWLYTRAPYPALGVPAARALLDNYVVQTDREILTLLVELPGASGDPYSAIRERAQAYLNALAATGLGKSLNGRLQPAPAPGGRIGL
jgi:hypothetical protein